jgi:P-type Ca2+ transporter type 2B
MDSLASLALSTEPPKIELLNRPPYRRDEYIISRKMVKHLLGMALYEIIIVYAIVFAGEYFYPEPEMYWRFDRPNNPYVYPGRVEDWDGTILWKKYQGVVGASRHMSNVFNVFVVMQIFNMINSRKINDELNVFEGITDNWTYIGIWMFIFGGQAVIVEFGEKALKVNKGGLHYSHWIIAILLGFTTWIVSLVLKFVPDTWCPQFGKKQKNPLDMNEPSVLGIRRNRTQSF